MNGTRNQCCIFIMHMCYIRCLGSAVGFVSFLFLTCNSYFYIVPVINIPSFIHSENYVGGVLFVQ